MSKSLLLSVVVLPPTHFVTLHPGTSGKTDAAFTKAITEFLNELRDRCNRGLEYLVVNEWQRGVRHAHALIRAEGKLPRRAVSSAKRAAGLADCSSVMPVQSIPAVVKYLFKDMKGKKAELTPASFRGRMYTASKGFLTKPFKELWKEVKRAEFN